MMKTTTCQDVAALMASDALFAVFDVRERGEYNERQIPNTTSLPRSQIEFRIAELVPNRNVPVVLYDDDGRRTELAAKTFDELGFQQVLLLEGGLAAWQAEGRVTVSGVNVPSKAFGEIVHHDRNVPDISPEELKDLMDRNAELTIIDMRTPEEYSRFCIPGGLNVPGGDLILWAEELRHKPTVIVNCAGRTRSIIGAAGLRRLGLTNVRALRNGTMGWVLAGFQLENLPMRRTSVAPAESKAKAVAAALRIAEEEKISLLSIDEILRAMDTNSEAVRYLIDVRSDEEFNSGHLPGSINVPGGQAVQRADDFVPVRNGQIVFISNESARAIMAAYWYRYMGFKNVSILRGGLSAWKARGGQLDTEIAAPEPLGLASAKKSARFVDAVKLQAQINDGSSVVLDVGPSLEYESAHLPGAKWISRGWVDIKLPELMADRGRRIILTCPDGRQSTLAARQVAQVGYTNVNVLDRGVRGWRKA
ncbi:MAG TPA: rhodanese-like domain-containing protein, partial [Acidobacteriota bacterium]|nr:rhodanese-like domain-containing protein [Acidobacteriota bacterium]